MTGNLVSLFFHIIAGSVWIGGQITLAFIVPVVRSDRAMVTAVARRFAMLAWGAYAVLVLSGIENLININHAGLWGSAAGRDLIIKFVLVFITGASAAMHSFVQGPRMRNRFDRKAIAAGTGILGAVTLLSALGAAWLGVVVANSPG